MVSGSRIINGCIALVFVLTLMMPEAFADSSSTRLVREAKSGSGKLQPRNQLGRSYYVKRSEEQRPQRLSPEERRQLRRDIKDVAEGNLSAAQIISQYAERDIQA